MTPPGDKSSSLFDVLESRGWVWEGERLYPPKRMFWAQGTRGHTAHPGMLLGMRAMVQAALENNRANRLAHWSEEQHRDWVSDMESLAGGLESLLEEAGLS